MFIESKSNLARLMATENLIVEQKHVRTASFDLKNRILTIPTLNGEISASLMDLLIGHEVGHALETPEEGWHHSVVDMKVNRSILNVCEDVRIEKKIKRKFPGIRSSFIKGYNELMEMDFFEIKNKNLSKMNFIDRLNLHTKCGVSLGIEFSKKEKALLNEVEKTETFEDVVQVSKKIENFMKDEIKKGELEQLSLILSKNALNDMLMVDEKSEANEKIEGDEIEIIETPQIDEEDKSLKNETNDGRGGGTGSSKNEEEIKSETDEAFRKNAESLYEKTGKELQYSNIPEIILENVIVPHKKILEEVEKEFIHYHSKNIFDLNQKILLKNFNEFKNESNKVVSYLVKEFEMRKSADQQLRAKVSKTGELNMSKIHEYHFTDDIFSRMTKVSDGKSHGLVMFVDWSGSMCEHIYSTIKQLLNLVMFCKKVNIPYEVYAFTTAYQKNSMLPTKNKIGDLALHSFSLLNLFSHRMSIKEFTQMSSILLNFGSVQGRKSSNLLVFPEMLTLSGTPLNEAILSAFEIIPDFKKKNNLQVVNAVFLTDGEGGVLRGKIVNVKREDEISKRRVDTEECNTNWSQRGFFRDSVTKSVIEMPARGYYSTVASLQTTALLKLLKDRTDCNLIGFYIAKVRDIKRTIFTYSETSENKPFEDIQKTGEKLILEFKKNNFAFLKNTGYDEYYFLRSDKLDTDDEEEFQVSSTTTRSLVNAFSKYTSNRVNNRIILNRFINLIS